MKGKGKQFVGRTGPDGLSGGGGYGDPKKRDKADVRRIWRAAISRRQPQRLFTGWTRRN